MKKKLILFISSIILYWADWLLIGFAWANFYDGIYWIASNGQLLILTIMLVTGILTIKEMFIQLRESSEIHSLLKLSSIVISTILLIMIFIIHLFAFTRIINKGFEVGGFGPVYSKSKNQDSYYFYLESPDKTIRFKCNKKTYDTLIVDNKVLYTWEYRIDFFDDNKGILKSIDLDNYIDNRVRLID